MRASVVVADADWWRGVSLLERVEVLWGEKDERMRGIGLGLEKKKGLKEEKKKKGLV